MASYAIGIDLGTTYSVVGVFRYGKVEIIANDFGNRTTPSIVGFDEIERLIGDSAKQQMISNPTNTIYGVKRLMGRNFTDDSLKEDKKFWPNTIFHNFGKAKIQVTYKNKMHVFTPEEISAMIILKMKQTAEDYLGKPVTSAVITVPAYFNDLQRKATKDAAEIAELNVLSIINEPTAAAIAYGFGNEHDGERNVLIFDLGGGTFDVSILVINKLNFEVIATGGDTHLGGEDFDNRLVQHFLSEIEFKFKIDLSKNKRALAKLRRACETAKRTLTLQTFAKIEVDALASGFDFNSTISRARFEEMNADLFKSTILTVGKVLSDAKLKKIEIDEVVLVGGSTRIPKIQKLIKDYFCGKEPVKSINPDEAIAFGAAVQAARILGDTSKEICEMVLSDVTPLSLGIGNVPNFETMGVIIRRNTKIPVKIVRICKTTFDNQTSMTIRVFQGESVKTAENILIGDFSLQGFPPRVAGKEEAEVIFEINENGILKVSICSLTTAKEASMTIDTKGYLTNQQIEKMIKKSQEINMDDNSRREAVVARNDFETYCCMVKTILEKEYSSNSSLDLAEVLNNLSNSLKWLDLNSNATREDYAREKEMLEKMCDSFILQEILD